MTRSHPRRRFHSPIPTNLEAAVDEIAALRTRLAEANARWMKAVERRELDSRAMRVEMKLLREEIQELRRR